MSGADDSRRPTPFEMMERESPEGHPIDEAVERRLPQRKLRRRKIDAGEQLMKALGEQRGLWLRLEELFALYHSRREETYFNIGYEHGLAAGRVDALRAHDRETSPGARSLADRLRELAVQADISRAEKVAALLEAAWALALDLVPHRNDLSRRRPRQ